MNHALSLDEDGILTVQAKLASAEQWKGCTFQLQESKVSDVVAHLEDAERYKEEDERELRRLVALADLKKYVWRILDDEKVSRGQWDKMSDSKALLKPAAWTSMGVADVFATTFNFDMVHNLSIRILPSLGTLNFKWYLLSSFLKNVSV